MSFSALDGSVLQITAPVGALGSGTTSHTVVSLGDVVVTVETGDKSFGRDFLADLTGAQTEPYRGGDLITGALDGPKALIWVGDRHSLLLAYDSISPEDARAVVEALDFVEQPEGIVARGGVGMRGTTFTVPLQGGGGLDLSPLKGPAARETIIERGPSGEVTSILVNYPTASMIVNFSLSRSGASFVELVDLIDVHWGDPS